MNLFIAQIQNITNSLTRLLGRVLLTDATGVNVASVDATGAVKVTGTVTATVDTSALALETGGNLDTLAAVEFATDSTLAAGNLLLTSVVDAGNSSTTPLAGAATFTGTGVDVLQYSAILVNVITDVVSNTTGFKPQFSSDGTNWDDALPGTGMFVSPGAFRTYSVEPRARYFRMVYINGAGAQGYFRLQTILFKQAIEPTVCLGESTLTKRGTLIYGISSSNTAVAPLCAAMGGADSIATSYTGLLTGTYSFGYDSVLDKWHRIRVSSTSKQMRTVSYPDRPTSDLGAAVVMFAHGTVAADFVADLATAKTQSASYNLWITDITVSAGTDLTAEVAVQEIPFQLAVYDVTDSQNRMIITGGIPSNCHFSFNSPILIAKGHDYQTQFQLGGATASLIYVCINGYEEA